VVYRAGPGKCMSRRGGLDLNRSDFPRLLSKSCPCGKSADLRAAAAKQKNEKDHKPRGPHGITSSALLEGAGSPLSRKVDSHPCLKSGRRLSPSRRCPSCGRL